MENVVDTETLLATKGAHEPAATLGEGIYQIALHGAVGVGVRHIVEVATEDDGVGALADVAGHGVGLYSAYCHAANEIAVDGAEEGGAVVGGSLHLMLGCLVEGAVDACGLEVNIEHAHHTVVDSDVGPHGAIVGGAKGDGARLHDGVAAEYSHVVASFGHVAEAVEIGCGIVVITALLHELLKAENVNLVVFHL